ncbi:MHYT domain-containing protein [Leptospira levettii]|uniref:MHYT domain-containing protein n=1 Tax=Leptospira levettii TaxID=2023178 RepID=UPI001083C111|nr:MHYT domain-containing protein [Leptospira levettii]TGK97841.1 PAS domain S-box protein [Leptospira levettii]
MDLLQEFFIISPTNVYFVEGTYNPWFVLLSIFISILASWISLYLLHRFSEVGNQFYRFAILFTASLSLGGAVWSMHFIGMISFELCTTVTYNKVITTLSILPSFIASFFALQTLSKKQISKFELVSVGILVGVGIGFMHYMGMSAMQMKPKLMYDPILFLVSLVVAIALSILSIFIQFRLKNSNLKIRSIYLTLVSGIVMGSAISGMHYTGMAAARFVVPIGTSVEGSTNDQLFLAFLVGFGSLFVIGSAVVTIAFISYKDLFQNLVKSESRLRAIIETAADAIVMIDTRGIVQEFNVTAERMFGWSSKEIIGKNVKILMPSPFREEHDGYLSNYLNTGEAKIIGIGRETIAVRKDGTTFPIRLAIGHTKLPQDDIFVGLISDISERIMIENALKDNEEQLKSFIQNIPGVVYRCLVDEYWSSIFLSDAIYSLSGYPASDFLEPNRIRNFSDIIHPDDKDHVSNTIQNAIATSDTFVLNYRILHRSGDIRWVLEYGGLVYDENKEVKFLDGVILDNTDRRMIEEALIESKEKAEMASITKTTFLANMSHEIRTPMNAIIGFTEVLLADSLPNPQKKHLETIRNAAKSLLRLLNDILNSAKLDRGSVELEIFDFSLLSLIDQVSSTFAMEAKKKGLTFTTFYSDSLEDYYKGDNLRIRQILTNLIGNAIKFTKEGNIHLSVTPNENQVLFHIHDTGIGIAEDRLEKIFEPFTQADVSMSRRFGGTGLGTTISKQLVELMGGKIWVESKMGEGSDFYFSLPLKKGNLETLIQNKEFHSLPNLNVLIADDVKQNVELIQILMETNGHKVQVTHNGLEALNAFQTNFFDLVLMDIQMPEMDGLEATKQMREFESTRLRNRTPIIALSASVFEEDKEQARLAGMDGFVSKPIDVEELYEEIAKWILKRRGPKTEQVSDASIEKQTPLQNQNTLEDPFQTPIDWDRGIKIYGSKTKYIDVLLDYLREQVKTIPDFQNQIITQNQITEVIHKWKGVTSNLGIKSVLQILKDWENESHAESEFHTLWNLVQTEFQNLLSILSQDNGETKPQSDLNENKTLDPLETKKAIQLIQNLILSFEKGNLNPTDWQELVKVLSLPSFLTEIHTITKTIEQFDFETSIQSLKKLEQQLGDR